MVRAVREVRAIGVYGKSSKGGSKSRSKVVAMKVSPIYRVQGYVLPENMATSASICCYYMGQSHNL